MNFYTERERIKSLLISSFAEVLVVLHCCVTYSTIYLNQGKMKALLNYIQRDYESAMKISERIIMQRGANFSRAITVYYSANLLYPYWVITVVMILAANIFFISTFATLYAILPLSPILLDIVKPLNQTRKRKFPLEIYAIIDPDTYYYFVLLYEYLIVLVLMNVLIAVDVLFMAYVQHACTLFSIISYRMRYVHVLADVFIEEEGDHNEVGESYAKFSYTKEEQSQIYQRFKFGIEMHQNAIRFCNLLESSFAISLGIQTGIVVGSACVTGLGLMLSIDNFDDAVRLTSFLLGQINHLFFLCLPGQRLLNYSEKMYIQTCEAMWYTFPRRIKSLFRIELQRSVIYNRLTACKLCPMSMEMYLSVMQTTMSYFTVLWSLQ